MKTVDWTGIRIGKLRYVRCVGRNERGQRVWEAACDCGGTRIGIAKRSTQSCGCLARGSGFSGGKKPLDIAEKRFKWCVVVRPLTVEERHNWPHRAKGACWLCKCDCGKLFNATANGLVSGGYSSCGCMKGVAGQKTTAARRAVLDAYKSGAKKRNLPWLLSDEDAWKIMQGPCHYCGAPPRKHTVVRAGNSAHRSRPLIALRSGLDRVDNSKGYESSNVVPCCKICNRARNNMPTGEFLTYLDGVAKFRSGGK